MADSPEPVVVSGQVTVALLFTAHNIVLDNGVQTLPGRELSAADEVCRLTLKALQENFTEPPGKIRVADLGALEGGYSVALARAGYQVTAIEARQRNILKCCHVAANTDLPNLTFIQDDVRNLPLYGEFDAVLCSGLLYHLDRPVDFLNMLGSVTKRLLILKTHYSVHPETLNEGKAGHWYTENPSEESVWSSWENNRSFWLAYPHLLDAVSAAGFTQINPHQGAEPVTGFEQTLLTATRENHLRRGQ